MATARVKVYSVILFGGSYGDDTILCPSKAAAEKLIMEYAEERWPEGWGEFPKTLDEVEERWEHGSFDDRWDLNFHVVEAETTEEPLSNF